MGTDFIRADWSNFFVSGFRFRVSGCPLILYVDRKNVDNYFKNSTTMDKIIRIFSDEFKKEKVM
ncbi:MAG: hypothetical protein LBU62_01775, partial [Bacteroidales bacterium]|nr:hypothetical protein [Bacteroidales bacterium]